MPPRKPTSLNEILSQARSGVAIGVGGTPVFDRRMGLEIAEEMQFQNETQLSKYARTMICFADYDGYPNAVFPPRVRKFMWARYKENPLQYLHVIEHATRDWSSLREELRNEQGVKTPPGPFKPMYFVYYHNELVISYTYNKHLNQDMRQVYRGNILNEPEEGTFGALEKQLHPRTTIPLDRLESCDTEEPSVKARPQSSATLGPSEGKVVQPSQNPRSSVTQDHSEDGRPESYDTVGQLIQPKPKGNRVSRDLKPIITFSEANRGFIEGYEDSLPPNVPIEDIPNEIIDLESELKEGLHVLALQFALRVTQDVRAGLDPKTAKDLRNYGAKAYRKEYAKSENLRLHLVLAMVESLPRFEGADQLSSNERYLVALGVDVSNG